MSAELQAASRVSFSFAIVLLLGMGMATFGALALGVLASFIIDEFAITREQLGYVVSVNVVAAALVSPLAGRLTDRLGSKRAFLSVFLLAAMSFVAFAAAPVAWVMLVGSLLAAGAQAAANPATNKLIALHVPDGSRGVITGVKQSGAELGLLLGGVSLPAAATRFGWRYALAAVAVLALGALVVAVTVVPSRGAEEVFEPFRWRSQFPLAIWWLTGYGFLMGLCGAVTFFVPLFVEEGLGHRPELGGLAVAVMGLTAFVARIAWARASERIARHAAALGLIAALAVAGTLCLLLSTSSLPVLWIGVVLVGMSANAWNSVGMLAIMAEVGPRQVGSASGIVLFGFLAGLGVGPPLYGRTVDHTGSYDLMWVISLGACLAAAVLVVVWLCASRNTEGAVATDVPMERRPSGEIDVVEK
ncbi:MAG: MFS transporter [Acidimicrobiales bacterium]